MQKIILLLCLLSNIIIVRAQQDTMKNVPSIFEKMMGELKTFVPDTSNAPDDKLTRKIKKLKQLGGFSITEVVLYKISDDKNKKAVSAGTSDTLIQQFTKGEGKRWLTNAITWIYRKQFTYREVKQMVRFSKTSAGKKMAREFPIIILQSLASVQGIYDGIAKKPKDK